MKNPIKTLINLALITVIIFSGLKIANKYNEYNKADKSISLVKSIKSSEDDFLYSQNKNYRFWISIDNTNIDYPVVQGFDNNFYLEHDFFNKKSIAGSVFLDYRVNKDSKNSIIYAHNMRNGSMFKDLELFKNNEFFNSNNLITISKNDKTYTYKAFSAYYISGEITSYLQTDFNSEEDFSNYLNTIKENSLFKSDIEINNNDIITLSTCSYEGYNYRTVVHAQLIEVK